MSKRIALIAIVTTMLAIPATASAGTTILSNNCRVTSYSPATSYNSMTWWHAVGYIWCGNTSTGDVEACMQQLLAKVGWIRVWNSCVQVNGTKLYGGRWITSNPVALTLGRWYRSWIWASMSNIKGTDGGRNTSNAGVCIRSSVALCPGSA
jgi:hypothetical protein